MEVANEADENAQYGPPSFDTSKFTMGDEIEGVLCAILRKFVIPLSSIFP
jgi:hypothetical protein